MRKLLLLVTLCLTSNIITGQNYTFPVNKADIRYEYYPQ